MKSLSESETLNIKGNKFFNVKSIFIVALLAFTGVLMFGYGREISIVKDIGIVLFISLLIFTIGIITIGRNKWLKIEEKD